MGFDSGFEGLNFDNQTALHHVPEYINRNEDP